MRTPSREHTRAERLREHAAVVDRARRIAAVMAVLVRAREARPRDGDLPLEIQFARTEIDGRAMPAAVWVALRRNDVAAAVDSMTAASQTTFLVEQREVMGEGYRLQSIEDTLPLPEVDLLVDQLGRVLGVPPDVLLVVAEWGADDPRTLSEIQELLTCRFGAATRSDEPGALRAPTDGDADTEPDEPPGRLTMSVADLAQVLRLDEAQARALATLVRNATVTVTR
jgi:hypothetical protein